MQVKTRVTAGLIASNHNETLVRDTPRKRSRAQGAAQPVFPHASAWSPAAAPATRTVAGL